ncbi:MAG TPA: hypothetical protein VNH11_26000 [Pirellulales bacterium]|nr:hypothetical protein [Pirellulales bacterium]
MDQPFSRLVSVSAMDGEDRRSAERMLGHPLDNDRQLYIVALKPRPSDDEACRQARADLSETFAATEEYADKHGLSDAGIEQAVAEVMDHVRYGGPQ